MTERPIHEARVAASALPSFKGFAFAALAAVFMAITGALGTGEAGFGRRLLFWLIVMLAGAMIAIGIALAVKLWGRLAARRWLEAGLIAALMAIPQTLVVIAARSIVFDLKVPSASGIVWMFGFVLFVCVIMIALDYAINPDPRPVAGPDPVPQVVPEPATDPLERFRERLPPGLRSADLFALEAEDHYLRVHTAAGSALILLRLGDAVAELSGIEGAQTHRSWWVARAACAAARRADGRAVISLPNGVEVPVSRTYYKAIADAGWF